MCVWSVVQRDCCRLASAIACVCFYFLASESSQAQTADDAATTPLPRIDVVKPAPKNPQTSAPASATVVVSPTTIATPAAQIASSVTVITAADIERDHRNTVPDVLNQVPGLNVVQTGGPGGQASVFMRGTNSNHVKVFIDGIDAGDPSTPNGAFDFAHLLTGDIERIEVLRGPQSGLYGSDAIGGVISITTKRGEGPPKITGTFEGGSFGTFNETASLRGSQGIFDYSFNVLHLRSTSTPVTPLNLLPPGQKRNNDAYNNYTYSGKVGAKLTDDLYLSATARYTQAKLDFTGDGSLNFGPFAPLPVQSTQINHNTFARTEAVWSPSAAIKNIFGVSYTNLWNKQIDPNPDSFFTPLVNPPVTNLGERLRADWRGEFGFMPGQKLVLGLEDQRESLRTNSTGTVDPGFNFTQTTTNASTGNKAGYVELQSEFTKNIFLVSNIRYDDNESFGGHTTWRIAPVVIAPVTDTKFKATYGTGFKAPTLTQLYVNNPSFGIVGNPNLLPETSKGWDAGFEQPLFNNRFVFGSTYFHNEIKNLIVGQFIPPGTFTSVNVGLAKTHGTETFAALSFVEWFKLRADYTYTHTENVMTQLGLLRRPGRKASAAAIWNPIAPLTLSATIVYTSTWVDIGREGAPPRINAPSFTTVNLAANYDVNKNLTVFARADNLFNRQYENPIGFMRPGLGVFGGVRVTN